MPRMSAPGRSFHPSYVIYRPEMSGQISVDSLGVDWRHDAGFRVHRPKGLPDLWVLVLFTGRVEIGVQGVARPFPAGTGILYAPGSFQWYQAAGTDFGNHWLKVGGGGMAALVRRCGLPVDEPFRLPDFERVPALLTDLGREIGGRPLRWERAAALLVEQILINLARLAHAPGTLRAPEGAEQVAGLRALRAEMRQHPERNWTLTGMAARAGLRRSRFSELWTRAFAISPGDDVIAARLDRARSLLGSGRHRVAEVARLAGFRERSHFSRLFRKRLGTTPAAFRRHYVVDEPR